MTKIRMTKKIRHEMRLKAICHSGRWFEQLSEQEQYFVFDLASKVMSQGIVMFADGDKRSGIDIFPEAWELVRNPKPKQPIEG